jgi:glycosyltransferase involved in cell wall biosynthesis
VPLLRRERFDVIHSHMFGSNFWGTVLGTVCRVPVRIAHEHTWAYEGNALRMWLDGHVIGRLASRFVAVSEADAERMVGLEGVPADKVVVMPTGYVPHNGSVTATGTDIRAELGLAAATPLIATAATMRPQKALEVLVDAVALLSEQFPEAHLVIAGDGPERAMLEERTLRLGLRSRVHLLGARDDVDAILAAADIAALSSDYEGMPLFMFESAMSGTPLVATAVGALRTLVEDGRSGVLVPPRDPPALADGMAQLLLDPARRERIAAAAAERLRRFTIDAVALEFADLYERLVAEVGR